MSSPKYALLKSPEPASSPVGDLSSNLATPPQAGPPAVMYRSADKNPIPSEREFCRQKLLAGDLRKNTAFCVGAAPSVCHAKFLPVAASPESFPDRLFSAGVRFRRGIHFWRAKGAFFTGCNDRRVVVGGGGERNDSTPPQ